MQPQTTKTKILLVNFQPACFMSVFAQLCLLSLLLCIKFPFLIIVLLVVVVVVVVVLKASFYNDN